MTFNDITGFFQNLLQPKLLSPLPQSQTFENKEQALKQRFENLTATQKNLEHKLKQQAFQQNWKLQNPQTIEELNSQPNIPTPTPTPMPQKSSFDSLIGLASEKAIQRGFHPAPVTSQMAIESDRGQSKFAKERNNYYGIGAFDNNLDNTWKFENPEASIDAHLDLIENDPRYADAYSKRANPKQYVESLAPIYATDPNYAWKIMNTPEWRSQISN